MSGVWGAAADAEIAVLVDELAGEYPCSEVSVFPVVDDRGVVAVLVTAGVGRLVVAARTVELVPVDWGLPGDVADSVGALPQGRVLTVAEVTAGLAVVR